jgi:hypothetical protein
MKHKTEDYKISSVKYIYSEVNVEEVYKGCDQINELDNFLKIHGFVRVDTKVLREGWGDAFYKRVTTQV